MSVNKNFKLDAQRDLIDLLERLGIESASIFAVRLPDLVNSLIRLSAHVG